MTVSRNIKGIRETLGMPQETLAQKMGVTKKVVAELESGRQQPGLEDIARIAGALGVGAEDIIYGGNKQQKLQRKKRWAAFIVFGALMVAMIAATFPLYDYLFDIRDKYFAVWPSYVYMGVWRPAYYIVSALFILSAASLWNMYPHSRKQKRAVLWAAIAFVAVIIGSLALTFVDLGTVVFDITSILGYEAVNAPVLFLLPALGLYLGIKK